MSRDLPVYSASGARPVHSNPGLPLKERPSWSTVDHCTMCVIRFTFVGGPFIATIFAVTLAPRSAFFPTIRSPT